MAILSFNKISKYYRFIYFWLNTPLKKHYKKRVPHIFEW